MSRPNNLTIADQWAGIRREDDGTVFIAAVVNFKPDDMKVILQYQKPQVPATKKEANILASAHLYAREPVPVEIYRELDCKLPQNPPRRRLYTNLPWCEKKNMALEFAKVRDHDLNLINDQTGRHYEGSLSHVRDHADDAIRAGRVGIPQAGIMAMQSDTEELQSEVNSLNHELQRERQWRVDAENKLAEEMASHRNTEANRQAEVVRFKNEEAHRIELERRLAEKGSATEQLQGDANMILGSPPVRNLQEELEDAVKP